MFIKSLAKAVVKEGNTITLKHTNHPTVTGFPASILQVTLDSPSLKLNSAGDSEGVLIQVNDGRSLVGELKSKADEKLSKSQLGKILEAHGYTMRNKRNLRDQLIYGIIDKFVEGEVYDAVIMRKHTQDSIRLTSRTAVTVDIMVKPRKGVATSIDVTTIITQKGYEFAKGYVSVEDYLNWLTQAYQ